MKQVTIYTDGACSGNPGPGGWGAILMYGAHKRELSGGEADTTNNRMELTAVIRALSLLKEPCIVELWSDSKYVIDGLSKGGKHGRKVKKGSERLQIVHSKHIISQKCSGILILAKGPPNPMRFLPPKTHSKNPSPLGEGFLCFLTCNSPSHPSGPWAGRCDTPASAGI